MQTKRNRGSLTLEASLILPIFILAIVTFGMIIKVLYVQEVMQHTIMNVADEMAELGYIYDKTGILDIQKMIDDELPSEESSDEFKDSVLNSYKQIKSILNNTIIKVEYNTDNKYVDFQKDMENSRNLKEAIFNLKKTNGQIKKSTEKNIICALSDFKELLNSSDFLITNIKSVKGYATKEGYEFLKKYVGNAFAKYLFTKNIADKRLKELYVVNGKEGVDFGLSRYFYTDGITEDKIDIIITYKLSIPDPLNILGTIPIIQGTTVRAWTGSSNLYAEKLMINNQTNENNNQLKVYIIGNGTHYHLSNCPMIIRHKKAIKLKEALKQGYVQCEHCKPKNVTDEDYVYVTKYGNRYHTKECSYINPDVKEITLEEAKEKGYKPCKICKP